MEKSQNYESFSDIHIHDKVFFTVRADGHNFHALTSKMKKPYDQKFRNLMNETISDYLMLRISLPFFTFTFSDEFSLIFRKEDDLFSRRVEKLDSLMASALSAIFTRKISKLAFFDARIAILPRFEDVMLYLAQRQAEAKRNCINSYTFYTMISESMSAKQASETMRNWNFNDMVKYLRKHKIVFNKLPLWQQRGVGFYWKSFQKAGFNPLTRKRVIARRFKLVKDESLPDLGSRAGSKLVLSALKTRSND